MSRNYSSTAVDTTLTSAVTSTDTSLVVAATTGFPTAPFVIAIVSDAAAVELALVTGVAGTTLTVTRGYDSTTASVHAAGDVVRHSHAAIDFREAGTHIDATAAHGAVGAVVGTTGVQTLTNKDLTAGTNTFPSFITGFLVPTGVGFEWYTQAPPSGYLMQDGGEYPIATYTTLYNLLTTNGTVFPFGANTNGSGGAGSTHFRTPNRKGKVPVGYDSNQTEFNAIGKTGGAKTHTLTVAELAVHTHVQDAHSHTMAHTHTINHAHDGSTTGLDAPDHVHAPFGGGGYFLYVGGAAGNGTNRWYKTTDNTDPARVAVNEGSSSSGVLSNHGHTTNTPAFNGSSGGSSAASTATSTATNQNAGSGAAHNILQPFMTVNWIIKT